MNVNRLLFKTIEKPTGRVEMENLKTEEESKKSTEEVSREKAKEEVGIISQPKLLDKDNIQKLFDLKTKS